MVRHTFISLLIGSVFIALCLGVTANAQYRTSGWIDAGTTINVRTMENINANNSDGRVFHGAVDQDVYDRNGNLMIPRGSEAELIARRLSNNEMALDLDSITVNGQRYGVQSTEAAVGGNSGSGLGVNKRTGEYVGGGGLLGAIIGAIAGGGKGAAIGAGAGAAAGAGAQVLTRGRRIEVPAESLLTFNLTQPLQQGVYDQGYMRNGYHYHRGYGNETAEYQRGVRDGRADASRNMPWNAQARRFRTQAQRRDYEAGYNDGYHGNSDVAARQKPGYGYGGYGNNGYENNGYGGYSNSGASIGIDQYNNVNWQAAAPDSRIYVQMDNQAPKLFASGQSGSQAANWMQSGHIYTFMLQDGNGNEIARTVRDLR